MTVPVTIEIHDSEPDLDLDSCEYVAECSLALESGKLIIKGCTDPIDDASKLTIPESDYRLRMEHRNLNSISENRLEGDDNYTIKLWASSFKDEETLKQWSDSEDAR